MNSAEIEPIAEPDRINYAVLRKGQCRLESVETGRLAQNVICNK